MNAPPPARSYYEATVDRPQFLSRPAGQERADVCVIGGGLTGISAALELAEAGLTVMVLEAGRIGGGASGRNGGQINYGLSPGATGLLDLFDRDRARALMDLAEEAIALIDRRVERYGIDCDLARGFIYGSVKPRRMAHMREEVAALHDVFGLDRFRLLDRQQAIAETGSQRFVGGLYDPGSGHIHSLKYCLGLANAAVAAGARLYEGAPVVSVDPDAGVVRTADAEIRADHIVLAANAYLDGLGRSFRSGGLAARALGVGTWVMTTEPLDPGIRERLLPGNPCVCDDNAVLDYFRFTADNRLLFGGGVSYMGQEDGPKAAGLLRRRVAVTYPELADCPASHVWGGKVSITMNRLPDLGRAGKRLFYAQGFSGHGVAVTGLAGKLIAEAVRGTADRFDVMASVPHRAFPGGPLLRQPLVTLGRLWYRLMDLM